MELRKISFEEILRVWSNFLWKERQSPIEKNSAMVYLGGIDISNMDFTPTFIAAIESNRIIGVNSGHLCKNNGYRSRGLFVHENYRRNNIGTLLLSETIEIAKKEKAKYVWSYPKQTSWKTYQKAGFVLSSPWEVSELGFNAYCIKNLD